MPFKRHEVLTYPLLAIAMMMPMSATTALELPASYLGVILRPQLLEKISIRITKLLQNGQNRSHFACMDNKGFQMEWSGAFDKPSLIPVTQQEISLHIPFENLKATLRLYSDCRYEKQEDFMTIGSSTGTLVANWNVPTMKVDLDLHITDQGDSTDPQTHKLSVTSSYSEKVNQLLSLSELQDPLKKVLISLASRKASAWISEKFSNLSYEQNALEALKEQALWKSGLLIENGAIRLELLDSKPSDKEILFTFLPRQADAFIVSRQSVGMFFDALILNQGQKNEIDRLSQAEQVRAMTSTPFSYGSFLATHRNIIARAPLTLPEMPYALSDMTVILNQDLVNTALTAIYREGLLRFRATVNIGQSTKGVIANEALDTSTVISIHPQSAPQVKFDQNRFRLEVSGYRMKLGTAIEDRIIPSTEIQADSFISASLRVDNNNSLVLDMEADKFFLNLTELKGRMDSDDVNFFKSLANKVWVNFLSQNSQLFIFPFVFSPHRALSGDPSDTQNLAYSVSRAELKGSNIILDINAHLDNWSW